MNDRALRHDDRLEIVNSFHTIHKSRQERHHARLERQHDHAKGIGACAKILRPCARYFRHTRQAWRITRRHLTIFWTDLSLAWRCPMVLCDSSRCAVQDETDGESSRMDSPRPVTQDAHRSTVDLVETASD
jgi:hypothetical protein